LFFKDAKPIISPLSLMEHADSRYKAVSAGTSVFR